MILVPNLCLSSILNRRALRQVMHGVMFGGDDCSSPTMIPIFRSGHLLYMCSVEYAPDALAATFVFAPLGSRGRGKFFAQLPWHLSRCGGAGQGQFDHFGLFAKKRLVFCVIIKHPA